MQTTIENRAINAQNGRVDDIADRTVVSAPSLVTAAFLGLTFVFIAGFAQVDAIHNAAHDTRHSIGFPCH